jgi:PAS domain S-box-containing protein
VRYFRDDFLDPDTQQSNCALIRCFKTHRLKDLPGDLLSKARNLVSTGKSISADLPCLTLLATAGDLPEWNDRTASAGHAVIPLESVDMVERAPMISQLIHQMGLEIGAVLAPTEELLIQADERAYGVFHVEKAVGSSFIPAQDFVLQHGIQSVLGFGGLLPSGDLFAMILFSRVPISRETAHLFRTIALSVKLVLLPFTRGPVFASETHLHSKSPSESWEQEQVRSEIATLRLLIPALEEAALYQTNRLQSVVSDLQLHAEEVRKLGSRLGSVLESTTDAVCMLDRQWNFTYLNRHAKTLLQTSHELLGRNIWEEFPATINSEFGKQYQAAMHAGKPIKFEQHYPQPVDRWFEVHAFPHEEGIALFFHDITDKRKADAALIKNEKLAAVGRLASSIAHEINNPLESVTNLLFLAQNSTDLGEVKELLSVADRELRRVGSIASQTLRFHRQSSRAIEVRYDELLEGVLSTYHSRIVNSHVNVERRNRATRLIHCFEGEIRQVLNNLVGNAIDAMNSGGGRLLLRSRDATDWETGRKGLRLTVADTGSGMSFETQARSFEPFYTTKGMGGTGLGLWISHGIVDRHQGRILLRSSQKEEHSGTVFALFLPFDASPIPSPEPDASPLN